MVSAFTSHHSDRAKVASYLEIARRLIPDLRDPYDLQRNASSVLLVWGDRDRLVFDRGAERVLSTVPEAKLELLNGIGHCPQIEAPRRFVQLLLKFSAERESALL